MIALHCHFRCWCPHHRHWRWRRMPEVRVPCSPLTELQRRLDQRWYWHWRWQRCRLRLQPFAGFHHFHLSQYSYLDFRAVSGRPWKTYPKPSPRRWNSAMTEDFHHKESAHSYRIPWHNNVSPLPSTWRTHMSRKRPAIQLHFLHFRTFVLLLHCTANHPWLHSSKARRH